MKKNVVRILIAATLCAMALTGCGKKKEIGDIAGKFGNVEKEEDGESEEQDKGKTEVDITSKKSVTNFIEGSWTLIDTTNCDEIGTLDIEEDGKIVYTNKFKDKSADGKIDIKKHQTYDPKRDDLKDDDAYTSLVISLEIDPAMAFSGGTESFSDEEETDGTFYIAAGDGYDYLFMNWIGNGDSYIFDYIFQNTDRLDNEFNETGDAKLQDDWVFVRKNNGNRDASKIKDDEFYGFVWESTGKAVYVSMMDPNTYEALSDYAGRNYYETWFAESDDIAVTRYELCPDADLSGVFHDDEILTMSYPLMMCSFKTDKNGDITEMNEVDKSYYGYYDLGSPGQHMNYNGLSFSINDMSFTLGEDIETSSNAITDMEEISDEWILITTHINPHVGQYYLYNNYSGMIENSFTGANLTWIGDDITTAVYSDYTEVYNYKGNVIYTTGSSEVESLEYSKDGFELHITDFEGNKFTAYPYNEDAAMYRYADYVRSGNYSDWKTFIKECPEDALALVFVNPSKDVADTLEVYKETINPDASDTIYVVPLKNDSTIQLCHGDFNVDDYKMDIDYLYDEYKLKKGMARGFRLTVPEGIPEYVINVAAGDKGGTFPVATITGESDTCSTFILADESAEDVLYVESAENDDGMELADAYMDLLFQYREAQDNKYSEEQVEDLSITTELPQYGWPYATGDDVVKYFIEDIDNYRTGELVITYYDHVADIYAFDGSSVKAAYNCPYRGEATLYKDGMLEEVFSGTASSGHVMWYKLDGETAVYYPVFAAVLDGGKNKYYTYPYLTKSEDIVIETKESGKTPSWVWEHDKEISEKEYEKMCKKYETYTPPQSVYISEFEGF